MVRISRLFWSCSIKRSWPIGRIISSNKIFRQKRQISFQKKCCWKHFCSVLLFHLFSLQPLQMKAGFQGCKDSFIPPFPYFSKCTKSAYSQKKNSANSLMKSRFSGSERWRSKECPYLGLKLLSELRIMNIKITLTVVWSIRKKFHWMNNNYNM